MKHSWIMMMKKVSHVLDVEQAEETNNTNDEQETQQPDFMVEPAGDPAEFLQKWKSHLSQKMKKCVNTTNWNQTMTHKRRN